MSLNQPDHLETIEPLVAFIENLGLVLQVPL